MLQERLSVPSCLISVSCTTQEVIGCQRKKRCIWTEKPDEDIGASVDQKKVTKKGQLFRVLVYSELLQNVTKLHEATLHSQMHNPTHTSARDRVNSPPSNSKKF